MTQTEKNTPFFNSAVVTVTADTPVSDCVQLMRERSIGALIVISDSGSEIPMGIFTERDLLRHIDLIQHGRHWDKPVRTVMTRPLITVDAGELSTAAELMLRHGFRHLPVTVKNNGRIELAGILSMRDLFRELATAKGAPASGSPRATPPAPSAEMAVLSANSRLERLLRELLVRTPGVRLTRHAFPDAGTAPAVALKINEERYDAVFVDIDHQRPVDWSALLKEVIRLPDPPLILIAYDPAHLEEKEVETLRKIGSTAGIAAFAKPIDVAAVLRRLKSVLGELPVSRLAGIPVDADET